MDPESNEKCPSKRKTDVDLRQAGEKTQRKGGHVTPEAKVRATQSQVKECQQPPKLKEAKNRSLHRAFRGRAALSTP